MLIKNSGKGIVGFQVHEDNCTCGYCEDESILRSNLGNGKVEEAAMSKVLEALAPEGWPYGQESWERANMGEGDSYASAVEENSESDVAKQEVCTELTSLLRQEGGDHYKEMVIQPIEFIHANDIPFIEGCAIKYLSRWRDKGGIKDLRKCMHIIEILVDLETAKGSQELEELSELR